MEDFILFALVGFLAQVIDGALGMAYGVICSTVLPAFGVPPAQASASAHAAELFTTAASGSAHLYHRNIDWKLFWRLIPFGIAGGMLGAFVVTSFDGDQGRALRHGLSCSDWSLAALPLLSSHSHKPGQAEDRGTARRNRGVPDAAGGGG